MSMQAIGSGLNNVSTASLLLALVRRFNAVILDDCRQTLGLRRFLESVTGRRFLLGPLLWTVLFSLSACKNAAPGPVRKIVLQQTWELKSGDFISGHLITGGLGDITVDLGHAKLRAPYPGKVELAADGADCVYFSTPHIPAYLFRYCGIKHPHLGTVNSGQTLGHGHQIHFATLRRQPEGTWAIVEPSHHVLEKSLLPNHRPSFF